MTPRAIDILRHEHRTMSRQLDLLEGQLDLIELHLEADGECLVRLTEFFRTYQNLYHHPKEQLILERLADCAPDAAREIDRVCREHEQSAETLAGLCAALAQMRDEPALDVREFHGLAKNFLASQRRHMLWEEQCLFGVAIMRLSAADWSSIEAHFSELDAPADSVEAPMRFHRLAPGAYTAA